MGTMARLFRSVICLAYAYFWSVILDTVTTFRSCTKSTVQITLYDIDQIDDSYIVT